MIARVSAKRARSAVWLALAVSAGASGAAVADDAGDRVIVTATRTSVDWLSRADSVARFEQEDITFIDADHPQEILNRAPGVNLHRGSGAEHLTAIRSPVLTGGAGAGSFLFLEDGVPLRAAGFPNVNGLFEGVTELAGAIEVVRGPGSVLYGSNAVHGTVNILTPAPTEDRTWLELSASTLDRNKATFALSRTNASGGVFAGVSILDEGGWRDEADVGQQKGLVRWDTGGDGWNAATTLAFTNLNQETASFAEGLDIYQSSIASRRNDDPAAFRDSRGARLQSRIEFERSDALTIAFTPYARWTDMEFLQHFLPGTPLEETGHWSVGSLLTAYWQASPRVEIFGGVDLEYTDAFLSEFQSRPTFGTSPAFPMGQFTQGFHYDYEITAQTAAAYADADIELSPEWSLQIGARAEHTNYDYDNLTTGPMDVGRYRRPADRSDSFDTFTPKVALLRDIGDASVAYVRYARGARAPETTDAYRLQTRGVGSTGQIVGEIEPETLDSFELGWRGSSDGFIWDVAAFTMDKEHFFFRDSDGLNVPDGETRHQGVEALLTVPLAQAWELDVAATYARHTYEFNRVANGIVDGNDIDTAPRWLSNTRLRWIPVDAVEMEAEWIHVDEYFMDEENTVEYPGHDIFNLRAAWRPRDGFDVFLIVRNALNNEYAERADVGFSGPRYFPGEDRAFTFGVRKEL